MPPEMQANAQDPKSGRYDYLILGAILLLALVLRIWGLDGPLWYDEIMTVQTHISLPWGDMMKSYSMNHHYLFSLQAKVSVALFGDANWSLRLPAMVFGLGSIASIWWLARDLAGRNLAHVTALLLAISYHHIWFSQNARGYSALAFFCTIAMVLYLRGLVRPTGRIWISYGLCLGLAIATHLTGAFFFLAQGLFWLAIAIRAAVAGGLSAPVIRLPALGYVVGGALTLAFYAPILPSVLEVAGAVGRESAVNVMREFENPIWTVTEAVRSGTGDLGVLTGAIALMVIALAALGGGALWKSDRILAPVVLLHIVLTMFLLKMLGMRIWPRFFFADIGFLLLLIVLGVRLVAVSFAKYVPVASVKQLYGVVVLAMVLVSAALAARNYVNPKQNIVGAFGRAEFLREAGDRVYGVGAEAAIIFNDQYGADWGEIETRAQFTKALAAPGPIYFVVMFPGRFFRSIPELSELVDDGSLELLNKFPGTLGDGAVLIFKRS